MELLNKDKEEIRNVFLDKEFLDFIFEMLIDSKTDSDGTLYREEYEHELIESFNELIKIIDTHLSYGVPINDQVITSFMLINIVDGICGHMHSRIKFYALCSLLYRKLFYIFSRYYFETDSIGE